VIFFTCREAFPQASSSNPEQRTEAPSTPAGHVPVPGGSEAAQLATTSAAGKPGHSSSSVHASAAGEASNSSTGTQAGGGGGGDKRRLQRLDPRRNKRFRLHRLGALVRAREVSHRLIGVSEIESLARLTWFHDK
jgi:hypothetical protein